MNISLLKLTIPACSAPWHKTVGLLKLFAVHLLFLTFYNKAVLFNVCGIFLNPLNLRRNSEATMDFILGDQFLHTEMSHK